MVPVHYGDQEEPDRQQIKREDVGQWTCKDGSKDCSNAQVGGSNVWRVEVWEAL